MGSKTLSRQRTRDRVAALLKRDQESLSKSQADFLRRNRPKHSCDGCGNGGHRRRAVVELVAGADGRPVPIRAGARA